MGFDGGVLIGAFDWCLAPIHTFVPGTKINKIPKDKKKRPLKASLQTLLNNILHSPDLSIF